MYAHSVLLRDIPAGESYTENICSAPEASGSLYRVVVVVCAESSSAFIDATSDACDAVQEHDPNTGKTTPTLQHFDVVVQPDILGSIEMSSPSSDGRPAEIRDKIREWLRRGHESVCLVTS